MKISDLEYKKKYGLKGQPSKVVVYAGCEGKRFWFTDGNSSFWMNWDQVERLIVEAL